MTRLLIVLIVLATPGTAVSDELGRLFFTPAERDMLDRARRNSAAAAEQTDDAAELPLVLIDVPPEPEVAPVPPVQVDGYVARSDGAETVWLNGTDNVQGNLSEHGIDASRVRLEAKRVRVPLGSAPAGVLLKPGQSFDPGSGSITDAYERSPPQPEDAENR